MVGLDLLVLVAMKRCELKRLEVGEDCECDRKVTLRVGENYEYDRHVTLEVGEDCDIIFVLSVIGTVGNG